MPDISGPALKRAFGAALRALRQRESLSQGDLADKMKMQLTYVSQLERGRREPSLGMVYRAARALGVQPSAVIREIDRHLAPGKQRVAALPRALKDIKAHMDASSLMMWFAAPGQKCMYANKLLLEFLGKTLDEIAVEGWRNIMHPEDMAAREAITRAAFQTHRPYTYHYRIRCADCAEGKYCWVLQQAVPYYVKGKYVGHLGTLINEDKTGLDA